MTVETWNEIIRDVRLSTKPEVEDRFPFFAETLRLPKETGYRPYSPLNNGSRVSPPTPSEIWFSGNYARTLLAAQTT